MRGRLAGGNIVVGFCLAVTASACDGPRVGPAVSSSAVTSPAPAIAITQATVTGNHVVVTYTLTDRGAGLTGDAATSLKPTWSLAALSIDPVSGLQAWQSCLLTGSQTIASLPVDGPGSSVTLTNVKQPGSETGGATQDLGGGLFSYTYQNALGPQPPLSTACDVAHTLRVGVWLAGATGSAATTTTFDFVPNGGALQSRELVLSASCNACHGLVKAHGGRRTGAAICVTCHTFQNADPDTVDPSAMAGATSATDPNSLELGRLVHRIHRGKNLPTLFQSTSTAAAPSLPSASPLPLPFFPGRNTPLADQKYSIVGYQSSELVYGQVVPRAENGQPTRLVATGVGFPQDYRNCDVCHAGVAQKSKVVSNISRASCQGCHPDVWYGSGTTDAAHLAHPGGPQADDTQCAGCHLAPTAAQPILYAPIAEIHVAPESSPRYDRLVATIVGVQNMAAGQHPTVVFTVSDRNGVVTPLNAPTPAADQETPQSPVPRAIAAPLGRVAITLSGPTVPDYLTGNVPLTEVVPLTAAAIAGRFSYTFIAALPASASGTWGVALETRREFASTHYNLGTSSTNSFPWPSTGETLIENADNPVVYVDTAAGAFPGGQPVPRRVVVDRNECNRCHLSLGLHGGLRHNIDYCVMCHTADGTDWARRPKSASGNVNLSTVVSPTVYGTYDGIEETSIQFKMLVHRVHTGGRTTGTATLDLIAPYAVYGFPGGSGAVNFFDEVRFPNQLENCMLCHVGKSHLIESIPAGAPPTVANESATLLHQGTAAHGAAEAKLLPVQASCLSCHETGTAQFHDQTYTVGTVEQCAQCHPGSGSLGVNTTHGLAQ